MTTTTKYLKEFVQISSLLTGFSEVELEATGMVKTYFKTIVERTEGSIVEKFLSAPPRSSSRPTAKPPSVRSSSPTRLTRAWQKRSSSYGMKATGAWVHRPKSSAPSPMCKA